MSRGWSSLRVRLAVLGFLASYVPALLLFGVVLVTDTETETRLRPDGEVVRQTVTGRAEWATWTVLALAPVAAGLAWWWAGRAVGPIARMRRVVEEIEGTDLSRRTGLDRGPAEVVALAASFDAMLERLEQAADTQRRLVEETSHELRIPLAVLVTNAEVLLDHPDPTVKLYRRGLERSRDAAVRLRTTVDGLLVDARGRARTLDRRPAELVGIVRQVVEDAGVFAAARRIRLSVDGPAQASCAVDEPTVRRAVANLVDNAIRYAPAGSAVRVGVETTADEVAVVVVDSGPGIPADQHGYVFQRFWRGRRDVPGTGLGLAIARQIALAHGGDLTLRSPGPDGAGCEFRLTLRR
ncbi:HAMP domain-containing sensor histidine kinase [Micromonospora sp. WMMD1102]|uniref:HAMP domain-containing sensor histidine kinase n=1 Tax=Micromonospora sp. WMMD1102 TaxID=3016105 RepID=UPI002414E708|nr:HAMP domain-containing sensor histidine kinase [Micromonospora sp. WMMD1102]MDG4784573.1 HAMP domain-containing sensor histidine kinase [Micromonospora sp. WMMD1102]